MLAARAGPDRFKRRADAGYGWPSNSQRGRKLGSVRGSNAHDLHAGGAIGIGDKLPLSMEMADRAIVGRGIVLIALSRGRLAIRGHLGGGVPEPGKRRAGRGRSG